MLDFNLMSLLPFITITLSAVIVMLVIAFKRNHFLIASLTFGGFIATLYSQSIAQCGSGSQITMLLRCDPQTNFFNGIVLLASAVIVIFCYNYFKLNFYSEINSDEKSTASASETSTSTSTATNRNLPEEAYVLLLTATLGAMVLISADHFAALFLGLETLALSLFALIAYPSVSQKLITPIEAAVKYLILSGVTSAFLCFGIGLIYFDTGILTFSEMPKLSDPQFNQSLIFMTGMLMVLGALAFKLSLVPFHMWTPDIYQGSPTAITSYIASVSKTASLVIFLKLFVLAEIYSNAILLTFITTVAALSMLGGNILALLQKNLLRLLAYSSISHMGYIMLAYLSIKSYAHTIDNSAMANLGVDALSYYIVAYVVTTLAVFGAINALSSPLEGKENITDIAEIKGLFWTNPGMALVLIIAFLSLAGIPLTIGFIGKFYLVSAGVQGELWGLLAVLVLSNAIGLYYYLNVILVMLDSSEAKSESRQISISNQLAAFTLSAIILALGLYPSPLIKQIKTMTASEEKIVIKRELKSLQNAKIKNKIDKISEFAKLEKSLH